VSPRVVLLPLWCACVPDALPDPTGTDGSVSLIATPMDWSPAASDLDPIPEHRPLDDRCPEGSWGEEDGALEVSTGLCRYAWLEQPVATRVPSGAVLRAEVWHTGLDAPEPAEAHVALLMGETVAWEAWAAVPSDPTLWEVLLDVDTPLAAGEPLRLHLHNHGANAWKLGPVTIEAP